MNKRILALEAAFAGVLALGAALEHWKWIGLQREIFALALLVAPAHARRLLAALGLVAPAGALATTLEAVALAGIAFYPVPAWAGLVAVLVAVGHASLAPPAAETRAPAWVAVPASLAAVAGAGYLVWDGARGGAASLVQLVLLAPIFVELLLPGRDRSPASALRRAATGAIVFATAISENLDLLYPALYLAALGIVHAVAARAPQEQRAHVRRRVGMRLAMPALALGFLLGLGELAFHVVPNRYRETLAGTPRGLWHQPHEEYVYEGALLFPRQPFVNVVRWNNHGWHDVDHDVAKKPGTARIVFLGDSYVEGVQVPLEDLYHRQVEKGLAPRTPVPVEGISLGHSGWGQLQELAEFEKEGLAYKPDLVVVEFLAGNDVRNNLDELEQLANNESVRSTAARVLFIKAINARLFFHAMLFDKVDLAIRRMQGHKDPVDCDVYRERAEVSPPELWAKAWERMAELVRDLKKSAASTGADLVVVGFTSPLEIGAHVPGTPPMGTMDFALPTRRMKAICDAAGVPFLDLAPRFAKLPADERAGLHLRDDGHWTRRAHEVGAAETVRFLADESPIWSGVVARAQKAR